MYKTINDYGIVYEWDNEYYYQKALKNGHKTYNENCQSEKIVISLP